MAFGVKGIIQKITTEDVTVTIKKLSYGEKTDCLVYNSKIVKGEEVAKVDPMKSVFLLVTASISEWDWKDDAGAVKPITLENVRTIDPDAFEPIMEAVNALNGFTKKAATEAESKN